MSAIDYALAAALVVALLAISYLRRRVRGLVERERHIQALTAEARAMLDDARRLLRQSHERDKRLAHLSPLIREQLRREDAQDETDKFRKRGGRGR